MTDIQGIVDEEFVDELIDNLVSIGVERRAVRAILIEGSALYLDRPNDIDFKVIIKWRNMKAELGKRFHIKGYKVECTYYTLSEWNRVDQSKRIFYYVTESPDMILVYGTDEGFKRFDIVNDKTLAAKVYGFYDKYLFNYNAPKRKDRNRDEEEMKMQQKRLWNFLLFAFKIINGSHSLTTEQIHAVQDAHDLKTPIEDCRVIFDELSSLLGAEAK